MNGAGVGGRLVAKRVKVNGTNVARAGRSGLGNREQRREDLRAAFGVKG